MTAFAWLNCLIWSTLSQKKNSTDKLQLSANLPNDGHTCIGFNADMAYAPICPKRIGDKVFVTGVYSNNIQKRV